jgi:hypothetical protein
VGEDGCAQKRRGDFRGVQECISGHRLQVMRLCELIACTTPDLGTLLRISGNDWQAGEPVDPAVPGIENWVPAVGAVLVLSGGER